ncbi:MAG: signal peptidase I, partial [Deltaproteobacteria bacterium]|nr:signal peptidase I [Deltaproteobacteria bacterium]
YIKRVVGLPGDLIEVRSGHVIMNGTTLDLPESKIPESKVNNLCSSEKILDTVYSVCIEQPIMDDMPSVKVPEYTVFVLGDFRSQITTKIKKSWGLVPAASLKGKPRLIWLSITPKQESQETGWFYRVRFDRMLRRIN